MTAMGIVSTAQKIGYAVVGDDELHEFGTIHRRSVVGFDPHYDERLQEAAGIAAEHGAAIFVENPILYRDPKTWPEFMARCEVIGEIGVAARGAGVRVYRAEPARWSETIFRSRLGAKSHERHVRAYAAKLARVELEPLEATAACVAGYGCLYLSGDVAATLSPSGA